jgi:hypothetical protein
MAPSSSSYARPAITQCVVVQCMREGNKEDRSLGARVYVLARCRFCSARICRQPSDEKQWLSLIRLKVWPRYVTEFVAQACDGAGELGALVHEKRLWAKPLFGPDLLGNSEVFCFRFSK